MTTRSSCLEVNGFGLDFTINMSFLSSWATAHNLRISENIFLDCLLGVFPVDRRNFAVLHDLSSSCIFFQANLLQSWVFSTWTLLIARGSMAAAEFSDTNLHTVQCSARHVEGCLDWKSLHAFMLFLPLVNWTVMGTRLTFVIKDCIRGLELKCPFFYQFYCIINWFRIRSYDYWFCWFFY